MEDLRFEIVKNCAGTVISPNIPNGKRIDVALLFKSILPTGHILIRLLDDLPQLEKEIDEMLSKPIFEPDLTNSDMEDNDVVIVDGENQPSSSATGAEHGKTESTKATVPYAT